MEPDRVVLKKEKKKGGEWNGDDTFLFQFVDFVNLNIYVLYWFYHAGSLICTKGAENSVKSG